MKPKVLITAILLSLFSFATPAASLLDTTFNPGTGADGLVEQVLSLSNGKIMICGNFTSFNGQNKSYIARLNSDGSVDMSFHAQPSYWVRNMSVQADGKIVIGGFFKQVQGISRSLIARLNTDGSLDTSFNPGNGVTDVMYAGIDGNVDPFVMWTAVQPDGKILATGNFRNYNGAGSWGLVRINPDGSRDTSFDVGGGFDSWGRHILVQGNGQILVSGWFNSYRGFGANRMARINPDGSPDTSFTPFFGDRTAIYCSSLLPNGKIMACGHSLNTNGLFLREFARLNPNGTQDDSFVGYTNEKTESLAVQSDGKIIVGGYFSAVDGVRRTMVGRVHPEGQLDTGFSAEIDNFIWSVALQSDGKLLVSGGFTTVDGQSRRGVARLLTGATGTPPPPNPSPAPVLSAQAASATQINLTWSDSATDRSGYTGERRAGAGGTYATVGTLAATVRSWTDSGLSAGTIYFYRLRATTTSGGASYSNEASATTQTAAAPASATFVNLDGTTSGTWRGVYGGDGYQVIADAASIPSYARLTPANKTDWTWVWSTTDTAALQRPNNTDRLAACWYSFNTVSIDVAIVDGQSHQVSFYCLDWDNSGRRTLVQAVNPSNGAILDQRTITGFQRGQYLRYEIAGTVRFNFTPQAGNAVVSGIFFGATQANPTPTVATPTISPNGGTYTSAQTVTLASATSGAEIRYTTNGAEPVATSALYTSPITISSTATVKAKAFKSGMNASGTASATFTINTGGGGGGTGFYFAYSHTDTATQGNWKGVYGADGHEVIGDSPAYPAYATVSGIGKANWVWSQSTTDPRALQKPNGSDRIAGCWYSGTSFLMDVNVSGTSIRRVALYFSDWDSGGRSQLVEVIDTTGAVIHSQTVSSFVGGKYLVYDVRGRVRFRVTKQAGPNAVASGLFFSLSPRN